MFYKTQAPLRVSLFGGGTDFPEYFNNNKGAVLGFSINKYIYTFASQMHESVDSKFRISYKNMEQVNHIKDINHPIIRTILSKNSLFKKNKWHFGTLADVPAGTGLGSSSAFTVSFLELINKISKKKKSKINIAKQANMIERNILKENVGLQDTFHSSIGGLNIFKFYKNKTVIHKVKISKNKINLLNKSMVMCYVGNPRKSSNISKLHIKKIKNRKNENYLNEMYLSVEKAKKILLGYNGDVMLIELGNLLNQNWNMKKNLSEKISNKKIDNIINIGLKNGAYGAKLCGAGGGGFVFFLIKESYKKKLKEQLTYKHPCMDIKIDFEGVI